MSRKRARGPVFRFFRGTIVARAPDSIFAHHFGSGGVNEGKTELPETYTLDRDPDVFARFFEPYLRGYPGPSRASWNELPEDTKARVAADADFYGIDGVVPPPHPDIIRTVPIVAFKRAAQLLEQEEWVDTGDEWTLVTSFLVASPNTYAVNRVVYDDADEGLFWTELEKRIVETCPRMITSWFMTSRVIIRGIPADDVVHSAVHAVEPAGGPR
ncbi:hypothetical protein DFJ74DRAFT_706091 [Hyaloraphidium curvatum]|nr:hypothetical protein DFJ74DRAFT_706091 [Hyaloraphidium curvatum]